MQNTRSDTLALITNSLCGEVWQKQNCASSHYASLPNELHTFYALCEPRKTDPALGAASSQARLLHLFADEALRSLLKVNLLKPAGPDGQDTPAGVLIYTQHVLAQADSRPPSFLCRHSTLTVALTLVFRKSTNRL